MQVRGLNYGNKWAMFVKVFQLKLHVHDSEDENNLKNIGHYNVVICGVVSGFF